MGLRNLGALRVFVESVDLVCGEMLAGATDHARRMDAFCETGAFDGLQPELVSLRMVIAGSSVCLVVPCYDEARRLSHHHFGELAADERVSVVFVDDGSTDGTRFELDRFAEGLTNVRIVSTQRNMGKGEAVRLGMLDALKSRPTWIGYVDADLSTPASEMHRLTDIALARSDLDVITGARVAMLGRTIRRSSFRHYSGRVFASAASLVLSKPVYDTQCGAKLMRVGPALEQALAEPFCSRWAFDVELLGRLDRAGVPASAFREEPLESWTDDTGSKRSVVDSVRATIELLRIRRDLDRWPSN